MIDIIHLLPDSIANQIAAGEVVQRPSSVVKELVENSIDAGANSINIVLKNSGKTSIQISDNGCGMSETDARMAFERHATSKINTTKDLFAIKTMGFRGEALASIASVSEVELKTKQKDTEIGTRVIIRGSELIKHECVSCPSGSTFIIKNLFYNIPARRKFLKADSTELRNVISEIQRIALANPVIKFRLINNDTDIYNLPESNLRQRIVNIFGKQLNSRIVKIENETSIANIYGFIGDPQKAKKNYGEQFLFVNNRFMKHPYLHKAIMMSYENLLSKDCIPSYFIYFEVSPQIIDINIHPTKTEIKFQDEQALFQILNASIRESLGKFNIIPSIDFTEDNSINIPSIGNLNEITAPKVNYNPNYNPFKKKEIRSYNPFSNESLESARDSFESNSFRDLIKKEEPQKEVQETQYYDYTKQETIKETKQSGLFSENKNTATQYIQLKNRYIITPVRSGLMVIDQKRAHEKILYEKLTISMKNYNGASQQNLFPETIELSAIDYNIIESISNDLKTIGFDIKPFNQNTFIINGTPSEIENCSAKSLLEDLILFYKETNGDPKQIFKSNIILSIAKASAIHYDKTLSITEINNLIDSLFACSDPNHTIEGKMIINILNVDDIKSILK